MKKIHYIPHGTPEWHMFRLNGIGGSEVGTLLDLNPYGNRAKMFYEKIGMIEPYKFDNEFTFHGRKHESYILDLWQYWDGAKEGYIENYNRGLIQRKFGVVEGYVTNSKFPYMFASLDAKILPGSFRLDTGEVLEGNGIIECKTISSYEANKWVDGIPRTHVAQITHYYAVLEWEYGELAVLKDGRHFEVYPIPYSKAFSDIIIRVVTEFWEKLVLPGKEYKAKMDECISKGDKEGEEKWLAYILDLEPSPSPGDSYKQFITERYQKEREEQMGDLKTFALARKDFAYRELIKKLTEERSLVQNQLIKAFTESKSEYFRFDDEGYVRFYKRKGSEQFQLDNRMKGLVDEDAINGVLSKINVAILK